MVSNVLNFVSEKVTDVYHIIVGYIGEEAAYELLSFSEIYSAPPDVKEIFSGECLTEPARPETNFALLPSIVSYAWKTDSAEAIKNAVLYASRIPNEFKNKIFSELIYTLGLK